MYPNKVFLKRLNKKNYIPYRFCLPTHLKLQKNSFQNLFALKEINIHCIILADIIKRGNLCASSGYINVYVLGTVCNFIWVITEVLHWLSRNCLAMANTAKVLKDNFSHFIGRVTFCKVSYYPIEILGIQYQNALN